MGPSSLGPSLWPSPLVKHHCLVVVIILGRGRLSLAAFSFEPRAFPHAKAAKVPLDGSLRCVCMEVWLRRDVAKACLAVGATLKRSAKCVTNVSGQRPPMLIMCDWRQCPSSQWCCPNDASGHKSFAHCFTRYFLTRGPLRIWRDGCALPQRLSRFPAAWSSSLTQKPWRPGNAFTWKSVHIPELAQRRLAASKNARTDSGTSSNST
jgi:hypothetical protein